MGGCGWILRGSKYGSKYVAPTRAENPKGLLLACCWVAAGRAAAGLIARVAGLLLLLGCGGWGCVEGGNSGTLGAHGVRGTSGMGEGGGVGILGPRAFMG